MKSYYGLGMLLWVCLTVLVHIELDYWLPVDDSMFW
jgi:hypothetical protein